MQDNQVQKGKYKHYKGFFYKVIDTARHSESLEDMVIYQELYGKQKFWVRPIEIFIEYVEIEGKMCKRFEFISED